MADEHRNTHAGKQADEHRNTHADEHRNTHDGKMQTNTGTYTCMGTSGSVEGRRMGVFQLGKWTIHGGLSLVIKGKRYIALTRLTAPNDWYPNGERQHLHHLWCPSSGVLKEPPRK